MAEKRKIANIYDWVDAIVFALIAVIVLNVLLFRIVFVDGDSMMNTLQDGERLIISNFLYTPQDEDIVVVVRPEAEGQPLIKRIIATEGQELEINYREGYVAVDGTILDEPYILEPMIKLDQDSLKITVPRGQVFVMGDNRNISLDSRRIGTVPVQHILGKVYFRLTPLDRFGGIE